MAVVPTQRMATAPSSAARVARVARGASVVPARPSCHRPASSAPRNTRVPARTAQMAPMVVRKTKPLYTV